MNRRLASLARRWLTAAGLEVTRVERGAAGQVIYAVSEELIAQQLARCLRGAPHIAVDIGAAEGKSGSNTYRLFRSGWTGLAVEAEPTVFARLSLNYRALNGVVLYRGLATPLNILELLQAAGIPKRFGFLSLDIDGFDHDVLDTVLGDYRPALICAEINERFPPPILFNVPYSPQFQFDGDGCWGQSIATLDQLRARHGYVLLAVDYMNAFLAPGESGLEGISADEGYRAGYADRLDRLHRFPWLKEFEDLQRLPPLEAVDWITRRFQGRAGQFTCTVADNH